MRESALWKSLRRCLPPDAMAERLENSVNSGMPDVIVARGGKTFLVELKADLEISRKQADWARRWEIAGGVSWFLIHTGASHYLVPGKLGSWMINHPESLQNWRVEGIRDAVERMLQ